MSLLNPLTILFWLGIYGSVLAETTVTFSGNQILINSVAIIVGIILMGYYQWPRYRVLPANYYPSSS